MKHYYLSHCEYFYSDSEQKKLSELGIKVDFNIPMKLTQLVSASDRDKARNAVKPHMERNNKYIVTRCRIDFLIVGE